MLATVLVVILIWPDRIAKLENGLEPVASIDGLTVTAEDLYEDMKEIYSVNNLLDIIDNKILYHSGASFKDLGKKCFAITKMEDNNILQELLNKLKKYYEED